MELFYSGDLEMENKYQEALNEMLATNKRNINRYCYDCGQKLDWSDLNE